MTIATIREFESRLDAFADWLELPRATPLDASALPGEPDAVEKVLVDHEAYLTEEYARMVNAPSAATVLALGDVER